MQAIGIGTSIPEATSIDKPHQYQRNAVQRNRSFFPQNPAMPAEFNSFGIRFLYPDNWALVDREDDEGDRGATMDLPGGGFVALELTEAAKAEQVIERVVNAITNEYETVEREDLTLEVLPADAPVTDLRFYYLDLLIVSRLIALPMDRGCSDPSVLVIQFQAESRDFDKNEPVFAAILKQIVDFNAAARSDAN